MSNRLETIYVHRSKYNILLKFLFNDKFYRNINKDVNSDSTKYSTHQKERSQFNKCLRNELCVTIQHSDLDLGNHVLK